MENKGRIAELYTVVRQIHDESIQTFTKSMLDVAPKSFWSARASRVHHPPDERGPGGNCTHTLRVIRLVRLMADSCDLSILPTDILISAAVIHDLCRYGLDDEHEVTFKEHALVPRQLAARYSITCEHAEEIFAITGDHMGRWGPNPYIPQVAPSDLMHFADAISAHADEIWEQLGAASTSWVGSVPFQEQGMTQEKMTLMEELAEDSDYWKTALSFVRSISSRKLDTLTEKQSDWLLNIIASLEVELNKRIGEEVFNE